MTGDYWQKLILNHVLDGAIGDWAEITSIQDPNFGFGVSIVDTHTRNSHEITIEVIQRGLGEFYDRYYDGRISAREADIAIQLGLFDEVRYPLTPRQRRDSIG